GVTESSGSANATPQGQFIGLARALYSYTGSTTAIIGVGSYIKLPAAMPQPTDSPSVIFSAVTPGRHVTLFPVNLDGSVPIASQYLPPGTTSLTSSFLDYYPTTAVPANTQEVDFSNFAGTGTVVFDSMNAQLLPSSYPATQGPAPVHQR